MTFNELLWATTKVDHAVTQKKGKDWYDRSKFDRVMFVDVTPNGNSNTKCKMRARVWELKRR